MTTSNDPDQIRADIERTRRSLSSNVDALAHEAKPSTMAKRQVGKVSGAVTGLRERVMGSAQDGTSTLSDSAQSAISRRPRSRSPRLPLYASRRKATLWQRGLSRSVPGCWWRR